MKSPKAKLSILIPVRNEGVNIELMLRVLDAVIDIPYEVLIIYDFKNDDGIPVVKRLHYKFPHVRLIHNNLGPGVANALKAGIKESKAEYILVFAIDDVGPVLAIDDMVKLLNQGCDLVSCTRYAHGGRRLGGSLVESILSRIGNRLFCIISGSVFTDSTTGIKMFRKSLLKKITLDANPIGWAVAFELAIKAQSEGLKLGEVPIISIDRLYGGKSTFSLGSWFKEYLKWFLWGVKHLHNSKSTQKVIVKKPSNIFNPKKTKN